MITIHTDLAWLPRPAADFRMRCDGLSTDLTTLGAELKGLASAALDLNKLTRLAKIIRSRFGTASIRGLGRFRLGLLANGTTNFLADAIVATAPRHGLLIDVIEPAFDQIVQEAIDPNSTLRRAKLDAVLLALDYRSLRLTCAIGDAAGAEAAVSDAIAQMERLCSGFRSDGVTCIVQTIVVPPQTLFGSLDASVSGTHWQLVDEINRRIRSTFSSAGRVVLDVAALALTIGAATWHDPVQWTHAKIPCALAVVPLYADHVVRLVGAQRGMSRRVLVLDLDNTLWSGVIGDDGLHGIVVGQGDAVGEAHLEVQSYALRLRDRGIVLAVSSKNDDAVARLPFREHPDMILKESHFAVFQANWSDKATNIQAIAASLDLTLGSFVFLDDNPAERALVRSRLPDVAVPELPADPALYVQTLAAAGYFETTAFSAEDRARVGFYEDNARRLELESGAGNLDDYLASLKMCIQFSPFDRMSRSRIAQLINKSNQFNLTTRRYSELAVEALEVDPMAFTLQVRLRDVFGDNGMISVVICREAEGVWEIDTWLMSCRVLKRKVENAVLREILRNAQARGIARLTGRYVPSGRNAMVANHYRDLGFAAVVPESEGTTQWQLAVDAVEPVDLPFEVVLIAPSDHAGEQATDGTRSV